MYGYKPRCLKCGSSMIESQDGTYYFCEMCKKRRNDVKYKKKSDRRLKKDVKNWNII